MSLVKLFSDYKSNMFEATFYGSIYRDAVISNIEIEHGGSRTCEYSPAVASVDTVGLTNARLDKDMSVALTVGFSNWIKAKTGYTPNRVRFFGKIGKTAIKDLVDGDANKFESKIYGTSAVNVLSYGNRTTKPLKGQTTYDVLKDAYLDPAMRAPKVTVAPASSVYDTVKENEAEPMGFSDVAQKYGADAGIFTIQNMDGSVKFVPMAEKVKEVINRANTVPLIDRSHIVADNVQWAQPLGDIKGLPFIDATGTDGAGVTYYYALGSNAPRVNISNERLDRKYIVSQGDTLKRLAYSLAVQNRIPEYSLDEITIPIHLFLNSESEYERKLAGYALTLQEKDPVYLAQDWDKQVQKPHIITGIAETINASEWLITLKLDTAKNVCGILDSEYPALKPMTWNQATGTWNQATGTWNG